MSEITKHHEATEAPVAQQQAQEIATYRPPVDIFENTDKFVLVADMPGLDPGTIDVNLERDLLSLEGTSYLEGLNPLRYYRTFRVMKGIDPAGIKAHYTHGVLTVDLPKPESHRPRSITVTAG